MRIHKIFQLYLKLSEEFKPQLTVDLLLGMMFLECGFLFVAIASIILLISTLFRFNPIISVMFVAIK